MVNLLWKLTIPAVLTGVAVLPTAAHAQAKKPPAGKDPKLAEAKRLFDQATEAYSQGRWEDAARDWEKSYELSGKALIFESLANVYERLGEKQKARDALAKWRAEAPETEHTQLDAKIKALDERIAAAAAADKAKKEEEEKKKAAAAGEAKADKEAREKARSTRLILTLTAGGIGILGVGAGVALDLIGSGQRPSGDVCTKSGNKTLCPTSAKDAIESSSTLVLAGDISWIAGAVFVAAGAALYFTLPSGDPPAKEAQSPEKKGQTKTPERWIAVVPSIGPTNTGFAVTGSF